MSGTDKKLMTWANTSSDMLKPLNFPRESDMISTIRRMTHTFRVAMIVSVSPGHTERLLTHQTKNERRSASGENSRSFFVIADL